MQIWKPHLRPVQRCVDLLKTFQVFRRAHPCGQQAERALVQTRLEQLVLRVIPGHIGHVEMALHRGIEELSILQMSEQLHHVVAPLGILQHFYGVRGVSLLQINGKLVTIIRYWVYQSISSIRVQLLIWYNISISDTVFPQYPRDLTVL